MFNTRDLTLAAQRLILVRQYLTNITIANVMPWISFFNQIK
ncbi:hypothetical protein VCRA2113O120_190090 [Vibrio crassostreae]|nr:hypothetical protein VCRA2113O120_190090 [Vibrio crassostreae]CAK3196129.1 hypothetical protein VCRA2123E130_170016 [Vibrio crassostreae]